MRAVFADSGYWVAVINPLDELQERAVRIDETLGVHRKVTSEMVLIEVLNHFSRGGESGRRTAVEVITELNADPDIDVIPLTSAQFAKAVDRYGSRLDQTWSLVDCSSFVLMEERGIRNALAYDIDFVQAGSKALLRPG